MPYIFRRRHAAEKKEKAVRKKKKILAVMRGSVTIITEISGIAGFLLALYTSFKE
jgi:hypothetical protein